MRRIILVAILVLVFAVPAFGRDLTVLKQDAQNIQSTILKRLGEVYQLQLQLNLLVQMIQDEERKLKAKQEKQKDEKVPVVDATQPSSESK